MLWQYRQNGGQSCTSEDFRHGYAHCVVEALLVKLHKQGSLTDLPQGAMPMYVRTVQIRAATKWLNFILYFICHVILCCDMTICHDMRFVSENLIYLH